MSAELALVEDPVLAEGLPEELSDTEHIGTISKLDKDVKRAALLLSQRQARWLVGEYYRIQEMRVRASNQVRASDKDGIPNLCISYSLDGYETMERNLKKVLGDWAAQWTVGRWLQSQTGIGPVISAGLLAHLDIRRCKTAGHFWAYAGLDPTKEWKKGEKRPWNAELKKIGRAHV